VRRLDGRAREQPHAPYDGPEQAQDAQASGAQEAKGYHIVFESIAARLHRATSRSPSRSLVRPRSRRQPRAPGRRTGARRCRRIARRTITRV